MDSDRDESRFVAALLVLRLEPALSSVLTGTSSSVANRLSLRDSRSSRFDCTRYLCGCSRRCAVSSTCGTSVTGVGDIPQFQIRRHQRRSRTQHHRDRKCATQKPLPPVSHLRIDLLQRHNRPRRQQRPFVIKMRRRARACGIRLDLSKILLSSSSSMHWSGVLDRNSCNHEATGETAVMRFLGEDSSGEKTKSFRFGALKQRAGLYQQSLSKSQKIRHEIFVPS